ncbi:MAG TPA: hypothetical protein VHN15_09300 [Thermoanaerobaculia bacterium]|nr:hypothetical protein [Thermoanaerobaculia bacterium]
MKKMLRVALATVAVVLAAQTGGAATLVFQGEYYCMCACPGGGAVCLVDDSPDCGVCANAAQYCPGIES